MFKNYLKIAVRNLVKTKLFSLINILGLAVGTAACLLILHYVSYETSYDKFHEDGHRIYRLRYERTDSAGKSVKFASCTPPAAEFIRGKFPDVEKIARIFRYDANVSFGDIIFHEKNMYFAEPDFLDILKFEFIEGDPLNGISKPNSAFISQSYAKKYFGNQDPIGKTLFVDKETDYQVTGIFRDIPANSHLKFDILLSFKNLVSMFGPDIMNSWGHTMFYTYFRLKPQSDPKTFENKLVGLVESACGKLMEAYKVKIELKMQPLYDIHLTSHFMQEYEINGNRNSVNFLFIIAMFIILIAWVNYINLSTARSLDRAKEVGIRKVVGASRRQLMAQLFLETILINLAAVFIALGLVELFMPLFRQVTGTPLNYSIWKESWFPVVIPIIFIVGVFLSGLYPVVAMSSFKPASVLKGKLGNAARGINLRKTLVVFQFVMSLLLITGTFTVYRQIRFMQNHDLGFDMQQVLVVKAPRVRETAFEKKFTVFKEMLLNNTAVDKFCVVTEVPGRQIIWDNGGICKAGEDQGQGKNYQIVGIDYDFVDTFDLEMVHGRNFSKEFPADKDTLILNETAVKWMGFESPEAAVGQQVDYWKKFYTIIGVMKDYHQRYPRHAFEPNIYRLMPHGRRPWGLFALKINTRNVNETIRLVNRRYNEFFPGNPFNYFFLDDYYNQQYKADQRFGNVFGIFSFLAIFVTGLGIFGLSSFMSVQRTREIGIRKALGATVSRICFLLTKDFMVLIGVSFVIALPLALYGIHGWLLSFASRMSLDPWLFLVPLVAVSVITILTTGLHVVRAAAANPVVSLRYE
jgi:putative ABC transport system permease protein